MTFLRPFLRQMIPEPVRRLGWRGYYSTRARWRSTVVGCRTNQRIVALTFDDGPNPEATPRVLEVLARYQVTATFFFLGRNVASHPGTVRRAFEAGHAIGNHTFSHRRLVGCGPLTVARELAQCQAAIRSTLGIHPRVMRPPYGHQDPTAFLTARLMGYAVVAWSAAGYDWQGDSASQVAQRILTNIQPGGIILLHDGWEPPHDQLEWRPEYDLYRDRLPTLEALPMMIEALQRQGYQFVTLPEMIRMGPLSRESWFA